MNMPFKLPLGDNAGFLILCGLLALIAALFFIVVYIADFMENRRKAKKKRDFDRATGHTQKRKQRLR